jgi:1-aminocyclopropane-1-carboxylate deaminase
VLVPRNAVETDVKEYHQSGNVQLNGLMSAETSLVSESVEEVMSSLRKQGQKPYFIPSGASTHPLGGLGFARWAFELAEQEVDLGVFFDTIVLALASGSTLGGMLAGFRCLRAQATGSEQVQHRRRIIGIQAMTTPKAELEDLVIQIANTAAGKMQLDTTNINWKEDFEIDERFTAGAYGKLDEATIDSIKEFASLEGILTDPVYTGKAVTGLMAKARAGEFEGSKNVLFVHTGGQASISAYPSLR